MGRKLILIDVHFFCSSLYNNRLRKLRSGVFEGLSNLQVMLVITTAPCCLSYSMTAVLCAMQPGVQTWIGRV